MTAKDEALLREGQELFTRLLMKFDLMEKIPFIFGRERITRAQLHMIEAIGKDYGATVTALAGYFMITKGAVSQIVTKLCARGFVSKSRNAGGGNEILLELTKKGREAFEVHEGYNEFGPDVSAFAGRYTREELRAFLSVLKGLDELGGTLFAALTEKSRDLGARNSTSHSPPRAAGKNSAKA